MLKAPQNMIFIVFKPHIKLQNLQSDRQTRFLQDLHVGPSHCCTLQLGLMKTTKFLTVFPFIFLIKMYLLFSKRKQQLIVRR